MDNESVVDYAVRRSLGAPARAGARRAPSGDSSWQKVLGREPRGLAGNAFALEEVDPIADPVLGFVAHFANDPAGPASTLPQKDDGMVA